MVQFDCGLEEGVKPNFRRILPDRMDLIAMGAYIVDHAYKVRHLIINICSNNWSVVFVFSILMHLSFNSEIKRVEKNIPKIVYEPRIPCRFPFTSFIESYREEFWLYLHLGSCVEERRGHLRVRQVAWSRGTRQEIPIDRHFRNRHWWQFWHWW